MRSSAARPPRGCSARCARSAGSPTRSAPTASSTWTAAWSRCTSAPARRTSREACEIIGRELGTLRDHGVSAEELERAKEHVKGRMVLGLEATGARMSRLARAILFGVPLLSLDEMLERVEQVSADDVAELAAELYDPERLSDRLHRPRRGAFPGGAPPRSARRSLRYLGVIRVAVSGAAGRMGADRLRGGRGGRRPGACRPCRSRARRAALGRRWTASGRGGGLHDARRRRPGTSASASLRTSTPWSAPPGSSSTAVRARGRGGGAGRKARAGVRRPQLRDRRRADDADGAPGRAAHARVRDRRASPRGQARRPVGDREAHRRPGPRGRRATSTTRSTRCASRAWSPTRR